MKMKIKTLNSKLKTAAGFPLTLIFVLRSGLIAYASGIAESQIATGTKNLISDATSLLLILAPIVAVLMIIYFCIRRSAADEIDVKKWDNRIVVAIVSCIGAVLGSSIINIIIGYYE